MDTDRENLSNPNWKQCQEPAEASAAPYPTVRKDLDEGGSDGAIRPDSSHALWRTGSIAGDFTGAMNCSGQSRFAIAGIQ
jgi:hypothetical protein